MKKENNIFYLNIFLALLLLSIVSVYMYTIFLQKEWEKIAWTPVIVSEMTPTSEKETTPTIILLYFEINNDIDYRSFYHFNYKSELSHDFNPYLNSDSEIEITKYEFKGLLPDELKITYFSFEESCTYELLTPLPYSKLKTICKDKSQLFIKIKSKGKIELLCKNGDSESKILVPIGNFQAKKILTDLPLLKNSETALDSIMNIVDYKDVFKEKFKWRCRFELTSNSQIESASTCEFSHYNHEDFLSVSLKTIPAEIKLRFRHEKCLYIPNYNFDAFEMLTAFRKINKIATESPIELVATFDPIAKTYTCYLTKDAVIIPLKNIFSDELDCRSYQ